MASKGDAYKLASKLPPPGKMGGGGDPDADQAAEEDSAGEDTAVSDLMSAFKSGDTAGAKAALKDFIEICYPGVKGE